jgi:hypothetical protein
VKKVLALLVIAAAVWFGVTRLDLHGGGGGGSGEVHKSTLDTTINKTCHASTGRPTWCTITIKNETTSNIEFDWTGASDPGGAVFEPPSGSVPIGATSDQIKVTLAACPAVVLFQDKDHDIQTGTRIDFCDPNRIG